MRLDQEVRDIEEGLRRSQQRDQFSLKQQWAVRPRDIQRAMLEYKPQIVHFAGHGMGEEGLVFEDESGQPKRITGEALAALFQLFADQLECVVLNGCYSQVQAKVIAQHIPYVIGMSQSIGDQAAIEFAVGFYDALTAGRPIEFAYRLGCVAIRLAGILEHQTPVLLPRTTDEPNTSSEGAASESTLDQPTQNSGVVPLTINPWAERSRSPSALFSTYNPATFTGREAETQQLTQILSSSCRVLVSTGMTGIGKTALVERVVANLTDDAAALPYYRFSLDDRSLTPDFSSSGAALLRTLGEEPTLEDQKDPTNLLAHLLNYLRSQPCRLQIDSLERLLRGNEQEGWSEFCDPLWLDLLLQFLAGSHCSSQLLLTSQDIPADLDAVASRYPQFWHCQTLQGLTADEQRDLFQKLGFPADLSATDQETLQRIGAFYDGHPLVLQVIADEILHAPFQGNIARYAQHYAAEFTDTRNPSNALARSRLFRRRVRQRVEQSLNHLPASARQMLCNCAVFRRPVSIAFWEAMLPIGDAQTAFETLQDRQLVEYTPSSDHTLLVRQHNLIRSVALDLLKANPETWQVAERQAAHLWLTAYEPAADASNLETVRGYLEAFDHYCELEDWESAKTILLDQQIGLRLQTWGKYQAMLNYHCRLLGQLQPLDEVACQKGLGNAYLFLSDYSQAVVHYQQSLNLAIEVNDQQGQWKALNNLGNVYQRLGDYAKSIEYLQQTLALARKLGDRQGEGSALGNLGNASKDLGQYEQAIAYHQQHLVIAREVGDRQGAGSALGNLGLAYSSLGQSDRAIDHHQQSLTIAREIGNRRGEGIALGNLGIVYSRLGQYDRAIAYHQQHLAVAHEIGNRQGEVIALGNLGVAYFRLRQYEEAIEYHQQSLTLAREIGNLQGEGNALVNLGETQLNLKQHSESLAHNQTALTIFRDIGDREGEAVALKNLAELNQALGEIETARQYCQQALALATELKIPLVTECEELWSKIENESAG